MNKLEEMLESNSEVTICHWSESSIHTVKHGNHITVFVSVCREGKRVEFRADAPDLQTAISLVYRDWKISK